VPGASVPSPKRSFATPVLITAISALVLAVVWSSVQKLGAPVDEISGTIEAVTFGPAPAGDGAASRSAIVQLPDGTLVQARITTRVPVQSGQKATLRVYTGVFSPARTYEIVQASSVVKR
jgi:hypothetical protein